MLSKSKNFMRGFISVILSLLLLSSPCLIAAANSNDLVEADASFSSNGLSNDADFLSTVSDQEIINGVLTLLESVVSPKKAVEWGANKFVSKVLGLSSKSEKESKEIMEKLDKLMEGQSKLQESMATLSKQVTCSQLNTILNEFEGLIASEQITNNAYSTLRDIDAKEDNGTYSSDDAYAARLQCLTKDLGLTDETMSRVDVDIDKYTDKLASALLTSMKVTYEDGKTLNNDLFEINYQSLRRTYRWENQAYGEWIAFQNKALGTYAIAATVNRLSLLARIEKINDYNKSHPDSKIFTDSIETRLKKLDKDVEAVKNLITREVVIRDETERYYWTPGHEMLFYTTPNTQGVPQENKKAGVGNTKASNNAKGLKLVKNKSGNYTHTVKYDFWKPFIRYEGGDSPLVNYDQLNTILKDYGGKKSLYDIFFSKDEGNFTLPQNVNKNCKFVIDGQKSEVTGKSYELTYEPYLFKADQVYCYGIDNSKTGNGKLPSTSKIHLCYYHSSHADPKNGDNCVGIGVKSVGEIPTNIQNTAKEETYANYYETIVWSKNMDDIQLPLSANIVDSVSVSVDDNIITEDKYSLSDDRAQITLKKEFLLTLEDGMHTLVVESADIVNRFSFTVKAETATSEPDEETKTDIDFPNTGDSSFGIIWIYLSVFAGLTLIIIIKKHNRKSDKT
ncbi:MAG: hypothetical protein PUA85_02060 [Oscillospiraceae bacterium]|nr:hypothetical protein [Oscillospiraceae bacterium]